MQRNSNYCVELKFSLYYLLLAHSAQMFLQENLVSLSLVENSLVVFAYNRQRFTQ